MRRKLDPLWEFGEHDGGFDIMNLSCKLCGHHMSGEVYKLKYHLAQVPGFDVGPCTNTNLEIIRRAMRSLEKLEYNREAKEEMKRQLVKRVLGLGYKIPSYDDFRGQILQNEKVDCTKRLEEFRATWAQTGCTVMSDGWIDQKERILINFLVSCPNGTMFMKSIDAYSHIRDAKTLCDLLDVFTLEVGAEHVVQVITDNAANCVAAGRMLMERHPTLFWTPCAAHCIDLMLEDIGKISFVKSIVES
eukprot:PITA_20806